MNRTCDCLSRECDDHLSVERYEHYLNEWKRLAARWERIAWKSLALAAMSLAVAALYATGVWHA